MTAGDVIGIAGLLVLNLLFGLLYFRLWVIIARPKPLTEPVKDSKESLDTQTVLSLLCCVLSVFLLLFVLMGAWVYIFAAPWVLSVPFFPFALSVRWLRVVKNKRKVLQSSDPFNHPAPPSPPPACPSPPYGEWMFH